MFEVFVEDVEDDYVFAEGVLVAVGSNEENVPIVEVSIFLF